MKAFVDTRQAAHDPQHFMANGRIQPSPEAPARLDVLQAGALAAGCEFGAPPDAGLGPIAAVHSPGYITFLQNIYARWQRIDGAGAEVIPNIHPANRTDSYPLSATGQSGYHQADTACPIGEHTWAAAYLSAQCAIAGADALAENRVAYALCRPPGHHAFGDMAGGFCFLNNAAIAARRLAAQGKRVAILDVDVHHGNGTQGIFWRDPSVLTVSLHADPARFYPFFWGHAHERGAGDGLGHNLNLPLPRGTDNAAYLRALGKALERIAAFGADTLVVALGLDAHEADPFKGFAITTGGFAEIAATIAALRLPTLLVQEGGYLSEDLGRNLTSFLTGFQAA